MKKELVCITCPNSCQLTITKNEENGQFIIIGNKCKRGLQYAIDEMTNPKRTISSTVRTVFTTVPVISVRVDKEIPKDKIFAVMKEINKVIITKPLKRGDIAIKNILDLGVNVICTTDILNEENIK